MRILLVLVGLLALALAGQTIRLHAEQNKTAKAMLEKSRLVLEVQKAKELADATAAAQEAVWTKKEKEIRQSYEEDIRESKATSDKLVADLHAGNVRLRSYWRGCESRTNLSQAPSSAPSPDGPSDLRQSGAGSIVRTVDQCSAQVIGLQRYIKTILLYDPA